LHWLITVIVLIAPPAGPAYNFIVNLYVLPLRQILREVLTLDRYVYPGAWINGFVTAGLIWLQYRKSEKWKSPWHTILPVSVLYLLANVFLLLVPFLPPEGSWNERGYPYYVFPVVGVSVLLLGVFYWACWTKVLPRVGGYKVESQRSTDENGDEIVRYLKIKVR
jgi:hypothetical protein